MHRSTSLLLPGLSRVSRIDRPTSTERALISNSADPLVNLSTRSQVTAKSGGQVRSRQHIFEER